MEDKIQNILISHPGRQHSPQTALALQEANKLKKFYISIWFNNNKFPWALLKNFDGRIAKKLKKEINKRSFPAINQKNIQSFPLMKYFFYFIKQKFNKKKQEESLKTLFFHNREFDIWTSKKIKRMEADIFIGYEEGALETFRKCKSMGISCVLDLASEHWTFQKKIFEEEKGLGNPIIQIDPKLLKKIWEIKQEELDLADLVFTPSIYSFNTLVNGGVSHDKISIIPYGVNAEHFPPKSKYERKNKFIVLFVGAITPRKGIKYLIEAFNKLEIPNKQLVLIGGFDGGEKFFKFCEGEIVYRPFKSHYELSLIYQQADVFVLPSLMDSFGLVVLEAMSSGTPVIVSENTGSKDLIENGLEGFVVPIRDVHGMSEKITWLYENPVELEMMGRKARKKAKKYSWQVYREKIVLELKRKFIGKI